jgi:hypothetical protein
VIRKRYGNSIVAVEWPFMRRSLALVLISGVFLAACGGGSSGDPGGSDNEGTSADTLTPQQLHKALVVQFLITDETQRAKAFAATLKEGSVVRCWSEGPTPICAAAVSNSEYAPEYFEGKADEWTFYKATFEPGKTEPEVEEVEPRDALNPEEVELALSMLKEDEEKKEAEISESPAAIEGCFEEEGITPIETQEVGSGGIEAFMIGGKGSTGGIVAILVAESPQMTTLLAENMKKERQYYVHLTKDEAAALVYGSDAKRADLTPAEACANEIK